MGIYRSVARLLIKISTEIKFDNAEILTISKQSCHFDKSDLLDDFNKLKVKSKLKDNDYKYTDIPSFILDSKKKSYVSSTDFFMSLGAKNLKCCDAFSYENPDLIIDLNNPLPVVLEEKFNIIFDNGTLEHVFNFPQAIFNISKLLKVDGYIILCLPSSNQINHGFYQFSPTLFFDWLSINGFKINGIYLMDSIPHAHERYSNVYKINGDEDELFYISAGVLDTIVVAKKLENTLINNYPTQSIYQDRNLYKFIIPDDNYSSFKFSSKFKQLLKYIFPRFFVNYYYICISKMKLKNKYYGRF
jgi:hypothetical protein